MPLDFSKPRSQPTLGRSRTRADLLVEAREKHPQTSIIMGLRDQGGLWSQRDPEEQRRIDRYKESMERQSTPMHVSPVGWSYFTREDLIDITDAVLAREERVLVRNVKPERLHVRKRPDFAAMEIVISAEEEGDSAVYCTQMIADEEMRRYNVDAIEVVDLCLRSAYKQLAEASEQHRLRTMLSNTSIKPVTH